MASASADSPNTNVVDEKLYSRQLYVMGHDAQKKMMSSSVVLIGCSGVGVEIAKNIILAGISVLTLVDPLPPTSFDLGANFYLQESHISTSTTTTSTSSSTRAQLCQGPLSELNPYVTVQVPNNVTDLSIESLLSVITPTTTCLVVTVPLPNATLIALNDACRRHSAAFIQTLACGVFGQVFCDFGLNFTITDVDGNPPASSQIESIVLDTTTDGDNVVVIKVLEDQGRHGLETDDVISLGRLQGVVGLDETTHYRVTVTGPYTFQLQDVSPSNVTLDGGNTQGYITQVKQPVVKSYKSYQELLEQPGEIMLSDFSKMDRPALLHAAFRALHAYLEQTGELPRPGDTAVMQTIFDLTKTSLEASAPDISSDAAAKRILAHFASGSRAQLAPMCAALGGIVGQEVLKACSAKFTPIAGFFYLDADECLADEVPPLDLITPTGTSRYDSPIIVFGKDLQDKILALRYFLVGAGAIGCEMLKNWALMGVGCSPQGHVYVTDLDKIEKSNLSRQFLFRNSDIDQFKSTTAAKAAQVMNPNLNVTAFTEKVGADTEHLFGDDFYDKLDGVCTALDNVEARLYVDQRCLFYRLPLLESGTLGTKGNTQVVVPHITENYGASRDPPEKGIPVCTLKHFPNQIQHTLQWARDWFEGEFSQSALDVNTYLTTPPAQYWESLQPNTKLDTIRKLRKTLVDDRPRSLEDCVTWARLQFESLFHNQIRQLLHNFPPDQVTSSGTKFWSGSKRCPKPLVFDLEEVCSDAKMRNHLDFIVAAANLRAQMYGIVGRNDEEYFRQTLKDVMVPDFSPQDGVKIAATEAEEAGKQQDDGNNNEMSVDDEALDMWNSLPKPSELAGFHLHPIDFDKDIDDHMLFVTACSNLRAMNYSIPTEDTHRSRAIAGRIIPAIATTTALVTGLICLELYKMVGTPRKPLTIEAYKNAFLNLGIPFMTLSEPTPPAKTKIILQGKTWEWTAWDSLDMNLGDITLAEFMDHFSKQYNLDISMLSHGVSILYSFFANKKKVEERKAMRMSEVITSITKKEFPPNQLYITLEVIANDLDTDEEVELPYIRFRFR